MSRPIIDLVVPRNIVRWPVWQEDMETRGAFLSLLQVVNRDDGTITTNHAKLQDLWRCQKPVVTKLLRRLRACESIVTRGNLEDMVIFVVGFERFKPNPNFRTERN